MAYFQPDEIFHLTNYQWNPSAAPVFLTALVILFFGFYVLIRERYSSIAVAFFLMTLPAGVWLLSFTGMYLAKETPLAFWWAKSAYLGVPFIPSTIYYFTVRVLRFYQRKKHLVWINFILSAACSWGIIGTDLVIRRLHHYAWGFYPRYELPSVVYLFFFFGVMAFSLRYYWVEYCKPQTDTHRARIKALLIAFGIAYAASLDFLAKFGVAFYPCGYLGILGFIMVTAHVMKRYRLVDITPSLAVEKIIGTMGDALLVLDTEDIVRVVNNVACELFEADKESLIGTPIASVSPNFPVKNTSSSLERLGSDQHYEMQHIHSDGSPLILNVSESSMKDSMGCVIATVLVIRDVTAFKKTQIELQETELRFNELYNEIPDAIVLLNEFGKFRSVNPAAERLLGRSSKELSGKIFVMSSLLPPASTSKVLKVIRNVIENGREEAFAFELAKDDKTLLLLKAYPSAVRQDGKIVAVQMILRETAEPAKFEETMKKVRVEIEAGINKRLEELAKNHQELKEEIAKLKF